MSGEPFMPTAEMTDEMLIDTGSEVITWGELQARKSVSCAAVKGLETHARELAHRIIMEFRPNGWEAKEDELYRLLLGHFESLTAPPARTYVEGVEDAAKVADSYEPFTGDPAYDAATDVAAVTIAAAIRLLSQGEEA